MTAQERDRITELARRRGAELAGGGLVARRASALKSLGWPDAVRRAMGAAT